MINYTAFKERKQPDIEIPDAARTSSMFLIPSCNPGHIWMEKSIITSVIVGFKL